MASKNSTRIKPFALAYVRVSTSEQAENGASLDAQRAALTAEATRRGWDVEVVADEGLSAKTLNRPGLTSALARLDRHEADFLMAVRLDRISRSVSDFAGLLDRATRKGWGLVLQSPNIDTSDAAGRFTVNVLASAAQYERELIGARTREGMAQRKAEGVTMGRPRKLAPELLVEIKARHAAGESMNAIARELTSNGTPTAHGGAKWYAATVRKVLQREGTQSTGAIQSRMLASGLQDGGQ
ncbi:recombinase family protein [Arthrobacter bambusae]|uniref:recombinase family protein n=1 Tax=Arthrobacter bambusae TaxID=1338426 RepID=UPI00278AB949|nr:recombinase family protein [Arthrobacter bambusae]MDQ0212644.1 DNA invertase Pin-like site-specific DNA recombinase [Arthrobacter bambusae]MDQ0237079.1 DNA invertase Pin-like site-specific DNA recombinase [Arthrobacter bambusae]